MNEPADFLAKLTSALTRAGIAHMLAGSFASSLHGSPRATQDIDLVIDPSFESLERLLIDLSSMNVYLDADVAREELRRRGQFNVIDESTGWKADLIFRKARPFSRSELERRETFTVLGVPVSVLDRPRHGDHQRVSVNVDSCTNKPGRERPLLPPAGRAARRDGRGVPRVRGD